MAAETITNWDTYWEQKLASDFWRRTHRNGPGISPFLTLVESVERSYRRILVVGCGISSEPALLARLGYEVVAIDVSPVAIAELETHPATDDELASWLTSRLPESAWKKQPRGGTALALEGKKRRQAELETLARLSRPNGSLRAQCLDVLAGAIDGPFDVVYSPWSWQCLDADARAALPRRAFDWLVPNGAAFFVTQNVSLDDHNELSRICATAGFVSLPAAEDAKVWCNFNASG